MVASASTIWRAHAGRVGDRADRSTLISFQGIIVLSSS